MKILHINSYFSKRTFYKNLYDKQISNGLDIDVFVPVSSSYKKSQNDLGAYTLVSSNYKEFDRVVFYLKHKKIYSDIKKKYKMNEYSLIHAHSLFSNGYIAMRIKQDYGIPYIVAVRNTDVNTFFKYMIHLRSLGIKILRKAERIVFLSSSYRDVVLENYASKYKNELLDKTVIIPNGIDKFWFNNKSSLKDIPKDKKIRLLYIGDINKNKNIITTVKAINILRDQGYSVDYTIVGKIKDYSIYNEIKEVPYINIVQPMQKDELIEVYRRNDVFVMPSIHETFGLVYAEAISQGLPVIYTKGQGFDGQFEDGVVGYSVDCFSPEDIAKRVLDVIKNYRILTTNCIELCDKFDWNVLEKEYSKVYEECVSNL